MAARSRARSSRVWVRGKGGWGALRDIRVVQAERVELRGVEIDAGDVDAVLRVCRAENDCGRDAVVEAEAAAHDRLLVGRVGEAEARRDVVLVLRAVRRVDAVG